MTGAVNLCGKHIEAGKTEKTLDKLFASWYNLIVLNRRKTEQSSIPCTADASKAICAVTVDVRVNDKSFTL